MTVTRVRSQPLAVQFLPVSRSGHLVLAEALLGVIGVLTLVYALWRG